MTPGAATPAAQTVRSLGSTWPSPSSTLPGRTALISVPSRMSTPRRDELPVGVVAQPRVERHQQAGRHLDQPDVHPRRVDVGEGGPQHRAAQLPEGPGQLDPGGAAADDDDR